MRQSRARARWSRLPSRVTRAEGFQIRDMSQGGRIVAIEEFLPMGSC